MIVADLVLAHGGGCSECGILTSILLLGMAAIVLGIPIGIVWLLVKVVRSRKSRRRA